jgi:hypothetical protein
MLQMTQQQKTILKNNKMKRNNMKNLKLLVLMIGGLFMTQHTFAQKGKITSAQLNLQDGRVMEAKKDIDAALMDAEIQKRVDAWTQKVMYTNRFMNLNCITHKIQIVFSIQKMLI